MTREQALVQAFPGAGIERRAFVLTDAQVAAVEHRARARLDSKLVTAYAAWRGDTLAGTAFFDRRLVRTMPAVLMIVVRPDTSLGRIDVLAFHEPPEYRPSPRWLELFGGRRIEGRAAAGDVRALAGATLTTRAVGIGARLALALYELVAAPDLRARPRRATP